MSSNAARERGSAGQDRSKPCFEFQKTGRCKFGPRCKFSHDPAPPSGPRGQGSSSKTPASPRAPLQNHGQGRGGRSDGKLKEWKRLLDHDLPSQSHHSLEKIQRFFQLGLEVLEGDLGAAQEAIKLIVTDPGLSFIKAMSERHIPLDARMASPSPALWKNAIRPLFQIATHPRVVDSAVLEQEVSTLFNYLLGVGGSRVSTLFGYIARLLESWPDPTAYQLSKMEAVELSLAVLSKMLDFNTTTVVNQHFRHHVSPFSKSLESSLMLKSDEEFSRLQATRYLDYIQRRLRVGDNILPFQSPEAVAVPRAQFVLRRDLPGHLSADGPRHDNDHAEIPMIKILPTYEEITSPRAEYLPTTDPSQWHIQGIQGRLDREFRLIREDTVGQLRDAIRDTLEAIRNNNTGQPRRAPKNGARTVSYDSPVAVAVHINREEGLHLTVRCNQLTAVRNMDVKQRRDWWDHSKRLQGGSLICVLDATGSVLFCVVSESTRRTPEDKRNHGGNEDRGNAVDTSMTLADNANFLYVKLQLVDPGPREIGQALRWYQPTGSSPRRYLVEFPGVLLPSFKHTLAALQQMYKHPNVPFHEIIAPTEDTPTDKKTPRPPQYARKEGFVFNAQCLTKNKSKLNLSIVNLPNPTKVEAQTTLDMTQSAALLNTLSRELSLIQGPPGTGKSYTGEKIIKLLLGNKAKAKLGPILCVCYTNHALDQLLEHLLDDGIEHIIRIGSRSKSERLQGLNLRVVAKEAQRTKSEKSGLYELEQTIRDLVGDGNDEIERLGLSQSWRTVKTFLATYHPQHHRELFGNISDHDGEGWTTVHHKPEQIIENWLRGGSHNDVQPRELDILKRSQLATMSNGDRRILHRYWIKSIRDPIITELITTHREFAKTVNQRNRLRGDVDLRCLQEASVVGVTTTGLARQLDVLRKLRCKVLICEEAGEVLEGHILTALLPSVEHAILIGDHLQLRPQIQNYELQSVNPRGERYSLDVSLFERLIQPPEASATSTAQIPLSVLETQRRMHHSIAGLIRETLYPSLKDAPEVSQYPEVVGMRKRLYWMHHEYPEAACDNIQDPVGTSHSNNFEIEMTAALVSHLVRQGAYGREDIAVITPYLGQLQKLRRRMQGMFEICLNDRDLDDVETLEGESNSAGNRSPGSGGTSPDVKGKGSGTGVAKTTLLNSIRIATVDNFQGEEAKVVIICLVRSNPQNNCGFLKTSNRINVLLSRAQHGMFIIGNANTYNNVPMWSDVIGMLKKDDNFGTAFQLQCPRHPDTPLLVSSPDHFIQFSPESGCKLPCDRRLGCGHSCIGRCHSQMLHNAVKCLEACPRPLSGGCDHPCPKYCGDPCPRKCVVVLNDLDLVLPCGHKMTSAKCWETKDLSSVKCAVPVTREVPGCGHQVQVRCHEDINAPFFSCEARCGHSWSSCGHTCPHLCYQCRPKEKKEKTATAAAVGWEHGVCQTKCGRSYTNCRHVCERKCHEHLKTPCPPCKKPCEVRCGHSKCSKECHEPCAPCAERKCHSSCPHGGCTMPCAAPCNWVPCSRRCSNSLECGHQCPSVCGERCPPSEYCQQCSSENVKSTCVDFLEMREYRELELDVEPCIFPDCGHFLAVTSMDGQMEMGEHYTLDGESGFPVAISKASEPFSMDQTEPIRVCPTCRGSLRNIARYGRIVRRGMLDEATKKFIALSNDKYIRLAKDLVAERERLRKLEMTARNLDSAVPDINIHQSRPSRSSHLDLLQELIHLGVRKDNGRIGRYKPALKLWQKVSQFVREVRKEEHPFQRVSDLVKHANRMQRLHQLHQRQDEPLAAAPPSSTGQNETTETDQAAEIKEFMYDETVIQVKGYLLAISLLLKCEVMIFDDFVRQVLDGKVKKPGEMPELDGQLDLGIYLRECKKLVALAKGAKYPKEQVQGHLLAASFCGFARVLGGGEGMVSSASDAANSTGNEDGGPSEGDTSTAEKVKLDNKLKETGLDHLAQARAITEQYPSTVVAPSTIASEIESLDGFLNDGEFYETVTAEELRAVYVAMAGEFRGTGHWYTCENGHPFTVGECGMPMERARCPECGAPVGGQNHEAAVGVRRDEQMEELARGVGGLRV